jgi:diacylglycerol O-acyltransferase / wax synthase
MWRVGQDATLRMTVGALMLLDQSPGAEALAKHFSTAAKDMPRLRQRPDDPTFTRVRPAWIDDKHDIEQHIRSIAIASGGSMRDLLDLIGLLEAVPFDPERPPWDVTLIEGLESGRAALYFRAHHALTDGVGGIRLAGALLDQPASPGPAQKTPAPRDPEPELEPAPRERRHDRRRGTLTIDLTKATRPVRHGAVLAREVATLDSVVRGIQRGLDVANSVSRQVMVTGGPLSPLFEDHSMMSRFEILSVPRARQSSRELGGSRNDLLVAAAARGLGIYHERMGHPTAVLRLATPAGQGRARNAGGNWFAPARVEIPTGIDRPSPQFHMVADRLAQGRREPALQIATALAWTISRMPSQLLLPALRAQADSVDFAATTVPGLHSTRHICGSRIEATYPFGPRLGCPVNITALGNDDRLDVGVALDPAAITKPEVFLECLTEAFEMFDRAAQGLSAATPDADDEAVH